MKAQLLIVEDEPDQAEGLATLLKRMNYDVCGVCLTAENALVAIASGEPKPDLILLDNLSYPTMTGLDLAKLAIERGIGVIFVTAYGDKRTVDAAAQLRPHAYIMKPIDKFELRAAIELALKKQEDAGALD